MREDALFKICVITGPLPKMEGSNVLVIDLIRVLEPLADELYVITSNFPESSVSSRKIHIRNVKIGAKKQAMLMKIIKQLLIQVRLASELTKLPKNTDIVVFYVGGNTLILAHVVAKLLRKQIVEIVTGSASSVKIIHHRTLLGMGGAIIGQIMVALERIDYKLADEIVAESESVVSQLGLKRYRKKIALSGSFFDTSLFGLKKDVSERRNLVGYIGRLNEEKGIMNFVSAIPLILKRRDDVKFVIVGDGYLRERIETQIRNNQLSENVAIVGWTPHEQLIHYYNDLKLLVVPSYSESVPIVALEAMACGTPVLATPVGGVPDVISDGENGFILKDNSPQCIAHTVVQVLEHPRLNEIAAGARAFVENRFTYQAATERYRAIFSDLVK